MIGRRVAGALLALAALVAAAASADVVELKNGDRVTGRVTKGRRRIRVDTGFGVLSIPRERVERIRRDDGSVEELTPPAPVAPPPPTPPPTTGLVLIVQGDTFWQAWDPREPPFDPSLRLELRLDEATLVSYLDPNLDPDDLPGAVVNSFIFAAERLFLRPADGVRAFPPEIREGLAHLALELPATLAGRSRLRLAYQVNEETTALPRWRTVLEAATDLTIVPGTTARVRLDQSRGQMEYTRRQMRGVETFQVVARPEAPGMTGREP
jgi:hypothetical protein